MLGLNELIVSKTKTYFSITIDLSVARSQVEFKLPGQFLLVDDLTIGATAQIGFNEVQNDMLQLRYSRTFSTPFYRFFITNTAQAGCSITLIIGVSAENFELRSALGALTIQWSGATSPHLYNVTCTVATNEYSQALPANTLKFTIKARGGILWVCFTSGGSGTTYIVLADQQSLSEDNVNLVGKTLYFQSPTGGTIAEVMALT